MKKIFSTLAVCLFSAYTLFAQDGVIEFIQDKHDFGVIEEGVQATYEFEFVNRGTTPITITNVRPSCGCTTPEWTKDPVAPGATGKIKASYNSQGRPGVFNKSITVTSNASEGTQTLFIKGIVDKKEETEQPTSEEIKKSPKITLEKNSHHFGKIERGQKLTVKLQVKNTGKEPLSIKNVKAACGCVSFNAEEDIPAGKTGIVEITYSPYYDGRNEDRVTIYSNDLTKPRTTIVLSAEVVDSLSTDSPLKEEKSSIPFK
ncbi:MAG: DUF1573 domain-containing protein [Cytophagaceae bacterium]